MIRRGVANLAHAKATVAVWAALTVVLAVLSIGIEGRLSQPTFIVDGTPSEHAFSVQRQYFGASTAFAILLEGDGAELRRQGVRLGRALEAEPHYSVLSPWNQPKAKDLRPAPGAVVMAVTVDSPVSDPSKIKALEVAKRVQDITDEQIHGKAVRASVTGPATIGLGLQEAALSATLKAELIAAPLLLIVLLLVFRSVVAAGVSLVFGGATVAAGFGVLAILTRFLPVDAMATTFASLLGLALGIDYSLLVVSRFREELKSGCTPAEAAERAVTLAGRT